MRHWQVKTGAIATVKPFSFNFHLLTFNARRQTTHKYDEVCFFSCINGFFTRIFRQAPQEFLLTAWANLVSFNFHGINFARCEYR